MKSVMGEETQKPREDVFNDYLVYYQGAWPQGSLSLCQDTEVTEKAKRFLLTESNPNSRFTVFDFYRTVSECLTERGGECREVLRELIKATEVLEMLCVNLFLFPWKKEIKILKTFTGPFVYWIKPVLPQSMVKGILESIGYHPQTDMEYRLDKSAEPERATQMGFELFLARLECEYLLEVMSKNRPWEFEEILRQRLPQAPLCLYEASEGVREDEGEEPAPAGRENTSLQVCGQEEEELDRGRSLVDPGAALPEEQQALGGTAGGGDEDPGQYPRSLEFQPPDDGVSQSQGLLKDDGSMREMREQYPDLKFRKKPVFGQPLGQPAGQSRERAGGRRTPKGGAAASGDLYTPPPIARLPESCPVSGANVTSPKLRRRPPDGHAQEKEPTETEMRHAPGPVENSQACADESLVSELAEKMGQLAVKDYRADVPLAVKDYRADVQLKYPVEETAWQDGRHCHEDGKATPLGSPRDKAQPIACHPSQVPHCSVPSCDRSNAPRGDSSACDTIKEPPQSYYIPPTSLGALPPSRGHALLPDDDLVGTYVVVEHAQKDT